MSFPSDLRAPASWARCLVLRLWSRRLTEPPRPANVWIWHKLKSERPERVAGAIGKLPDGLRPPPRVRRREIPLGSLRRGSQGASHTPNTKNPMAITIGFLRALTPHVRGGSVSRRGLTQAHRSRTHLTGGTTYAETHNSNASRFPGGSAREGPFSERPPPSHLYIYVALRKGVRGRTLLYREVFSPEIPYVISLL